MAEYNFDGVVGVLPNGDEAEFPNEEEYEDEYYDMLFDMQNCMEIEFPEDWVA